MSDYRAVAGQAWGEASSLVDEAEYPLLLLGSMSHLRPHQKQARRLHGLVVARQRGVSDVLIPSKQVCHDRGVALEPRGEERRRIAREKASFSIFVNTCDLFEGFSNWAI